MTDTDIVPIWATLNMDTSDKHSPFSLAGNGSCDKLSMNFGGSELDLITI